MGKKRSSAGAAGGPTNWNNVKGWKSVNVGDEFLLGSEEYGFMGLEELDASTLGAEIFTGAELDGSGDGTAPAEDAPPPAKKSKKAKKVEDESVDALKARLAALEAENATLRGDKKGKKKEPKKKQEPKEKGKKTVKNDIAVDEDTGDEKEAWEEEEAPPTTDVSAWDDFRLDSRIMDALARLGFSAPTHIQAEAIPAAVRDRRDVIGAAQTGSGKTLAFGLPIMQLLAQQAQQETDPDAPSPLRALILAPTRELAMQVCSHLQAVGRRAGVWVVPIVGGISAQKQERLLSKRPQVVVATPGRLWDLMREGQPHVAALGALRFLVIDEADRMVQQGHYAELTSILDAIPGVRAAQGIKDDAVHSDEDDDEAKEESDDDTEKKSGKKGSSSEPRLQTFVFSATLTLPGDLRKRLRKGGGGASGSATLDSLMDQVPFLGRGKPKIIDLTSERKVADRVTEASISCAEAERDEYLYCLLAAHPGRTIVFVNAISAVRRLGAILKILGLPAHALHAGMQQRARLKALDRFKSDCNAILVATDVAARGLDVKDVRCVVHYQLPASLDVYVHRSGRTARAEAEGLAVSLVTPKEDARYRALLRALGREQPPEFPLDASLMAASRARVRLAVRLDAAERAAAKARADKSWRRQHAEELGIELSDDSEDELVRGKRVGKKARKEREEVAPPSKAEVDRVRAELHAMLAEPLQPKFSKKFFTGGAAAGVAVQQGGGAADAGTVTKAVSMAQKLADSRSKATKAAEAKRKAPKAAASKKKMSRAEALAAAVRKQVQKKAGKAGGKRGMVVVASQALGRAAEGPDALQALRNRMAVLEGEKKA